MQLNGSLNWWETYLKKIDSPCAERNEISKQCVTWGKVQIWGDKPGKPNTPMKANWTGPCSGVHTIGAHAWLHASIIGREGYEIRLHTEGEVWYLRLPCLSVVLVHTLAKRITSKWIADTEYNVRLHLTVFISFW